MDYFSIIIPAKNEAKSLVQLLPKIKSAYPNFPVFVVDDGSTDNTQNICKQNSVICIPHPYSKGNGAAIKTGLRHVESEYVICMDADGQHRPEDIPELLDQLKQGYDMVVGARNRSGQANLHRSLANRFYNKLASWMVNHKVEDLTSGFRAVNTKKFQQFLYMLPNTFSYPTTITMAFFRAGYSVKYIPIEAPPRIGKSHLSIWKDGLRFLLIIFKIGTLYSPLKIFTPIALTLFGVGILYYADTYFSYGRFTNMSALLFTSGLLTFLMGLVSEQITTLSYLISNRMNTTDHKM
jgi:glycosyltransferase involved in cell wall biosynthesis